MAESIAYNLGICGGGWVLPMRALDWLLRQFILKVGGLLARVGGAP